MANIDISSGYEDLIPDEISFHVNGAPVSLQASPDKKNEFREVIRRKIENIDSILTGEVSIIVEWYCDAQERKITDGYADIDNILKPIIDGLCGSGGILLDDSQVQHISCSWIGMGVGYAENSISVRIRYDIDFIKKKDGLVLLEIEHPVYFPINIKNSSHNLFNRIYLRVSSVCHCQFFCRFIG